MAGGERLQHHGEHGLVAVNNLRRWLSSSVPEEYSRPAVHSIINFYRYFIAPSLEPTPQVGLVGRAVAEGVDELPQVSLYVIVPPSMSDQFSVRGRYEHEMSPLFYREVARSLESHLIASFNLAGQARMTGELPEEIVKVASAPRATFLGMLDSVVAQDGVLSTDEEQARTPESQQDIDRLVKALDKPEIKAQMAFVAAILNGALENAIEDPESAKRITSIVRMIPMAQPGEQRHLVDAIRQLLLVSKEEPEIPEVDPFKPFMQAMRTSDPAFDIVCSIDEGVGRKIAGTLFAQMPNQGLGKPFPNN